ncbi:hypothetical protein SAMN06264364_1492 [Quadrisphaera granulorum]|uniref:Uncharacterized protein n=1 Tax=Quadrisphaera granulorum TaxID=317664 RepID=A0A315ZL86_9ACTN|nr:hypothetical protein BXY45_1492 [Quadrisphaera granulorum]SZE99081.1 hypothetical protein SAMN06264364_1492 [Quadrisphaera granulorum]
MCTAHAQATLRLWQEHRWLAWDAERRRLREELAPQFLPDDGTPLTPAVVHAGVGASNGPGLGSWMLVGVAAAAVLGVLTLIGGGSHSSDACTDGRDPTQRIASEQVRTSPEQMTTAQWQGYMACADERSASGVDHDEPVYRR